MNVERVAVGTGSPEGTNSAYVVPERGLVVDPGPPGDDAWDDLLAGLQRTTLAFEAVEHVVVTHWHVDHCGLAPRLAAASDATIHMHERDAPFVATYEATHEQRRARDQATLESWGVPEPRVAEVRDSDTPSPLPSETPVEAHTGGDVVAGGTVLHTPGHTKGHIALSFEDHVFVGDTVLPTYTPNVGGSDTRAANPLSSFLASLDLLERHDGDLHPGHGTSLAVPERFEAIREHHRERRRRVREHVEALDQATPWDVAVELFGEMRGIHVKFGAGEAAAHLADMAASGVVGRVDEDPVRYESRDAPDSTASRTD